MILPNGYSDVPPGKIVAVVTHLEMLQRPTLPPDPSGAWTVRRVDHPASDWFRELYRRIGAEWLWISRLGLRDAELAALIQAPAAEIYAFGQDESLLYLDFKGAAGSVIAAMVAAAPAVSSRSHRCMGSVPPGMPLSARQFKGLGARCEGQARQPRRGII